MVDRDDDLFPTRLPNVYWGGWSLRETEKQYYVCTCPYILQDWVEFPYMVIHVA